MRVAPRGPAGRVARAAGGRARPGSAWLGAALIGMLCGLLGTAGAQPGADPARREAEQPAIGPVEANGGRYRVEGDALIGLDAQGDGEVGRWPLGQPARALAAAGDVLYVAQPPSGVRIVDVSDPRTPRPLRAFAEELLVDAIEIDGGVLRLGGAGGRSFAWYGVAAPRAPIFLRRLDLADEAAGGAAGGAARARVGVRRDVWRTLELRDGSRIHGYPTAISTGKYVTLGLPGGALLTLLRSEVAGESDRAAGARADGADGADSGAWDDAAGRARVDVAALGPRDPKIDRITCVVDGTRLSLVRQVGGETMPLGQVALPWQARKRAPLVLGRAAYVLLRETGLAVVDIGLLRFPYVVGRLLPESPVDSVTVVDDRLLVRGGGVARSFDVRDPLDPQRDAMEVWIPPRTYGPHAPAASDARWLESGRRWPSPFRRIYLTHGGVVTGRLVSVTPDRVTVATDVLPRVWYDSANIVHIEPLRHEGVPPGLLLRHRIQPFLFDGTATRHPYRPRSEAGLVAGVVIAGALTVGAVIGLTVFLLNSNIAFFPQY